jgi:hypothetical protein
MSDRVVFTLADGRWLVLSEEAFAAALAEDHQVMPARLAETEEPALVARHDSQEECRLASSRARSTWRDGHLAASQARDR